MLCKAETLCIALLSGVIPPFCAASLIAHSLILSNKANNTSSTKKPKCFQCEPDATLSDSTVFHIRGFKRTESPKLITEGATVQFALSFPFCFELRYKRNAAIR